MRTGPRASLLGGSAWCRFLVPRALLNVCGCGRNTTKLRAANTRHMTKRLTPIMLRLDSTSKSGSRSHLSTVYPYYRVDRNLMLYLPRLTVLVTIEADRPEAWFPGPLGPYICSLISRHLAKSGLQTCEKAGKPHEKSVLFWRLLGGHNQKNLFSRVDSRIT